MSRHVIMQVPQPILFPPSVSVEQTLIWFLGNAVSYLWMQELYIHLRNKGAFSLGALRMHICLLGGPSNCGCIHTGMTGKIVGGVGGLYCMRVANSSFSVEHIGSKDISKIGFCLEIQIVYLCSGCPLSLFPFHYVLQLLRYGCLRWADETFFAEFGAGSNPARVRKRSRSDFPVAQLPIEV
jgi:hypothetical protein